MAAISSSMVLQTSDVLETSDVCPRKHCNAVFLKDIAALEAARITHPDFERVRALLK